MNDLITIRLTAKNDAKPVLHDFNRQLDETARKAKTTGTALGGLGTKVGGMGRSAGQAGIQVQQLVGQIQGGTNPMLALSQQAADLGFVMGFPLAGAVAGLAASFGMVLLPSLFETEDSLEDVIKLMDKLNESTTTLTENQIRAKEQGFDKQIEAQQELLKQAEKNLRAFDTGVAEDDLTSADKKRMIELEGMIDTYKQAVDDLKQQKADLRSTTNENQEAIDELVKSLQEEAETLGMTATQLAVYRAQQLGASAADIERIQTLGMVLEAHEAQLEKDKEIAAFKKQYQKDQKAANEQMLKDQEAATKAMEKNLKPVEDGLVGLISGTKSASDAFRDMARSIIEDLIRMQIQSSITKPLAGMLSGFDFGSLFGGTSSGTGVGTGATPLSGISVGTPYKMALGGSVSAGQAYTVGEHGRETFVPSTDGQILPNGAEGGVTIVQNINVSTGVSQTVRAEIANLMPQISNAAKSAVADARQRGGGFSKAMGA
jgi:hypothetical protein